MFSGWVSRMFIGWSGQRISVERSKRKKIKNKRRVLQLDTLRMHLIYRFHNSWKRNPATATLDAKGYIMYQRQRDRLLMHLDRTCRSIDRLEIVQLHEDLCWTRAFRNHFRPHLRWFLFILQIRWSPIVEKFLRVLIINSEFIASIGNCRILFSILIYYL